MRKESSETAAARSRRSEIVEIRGWRYRLLWIVGKAMRIWCRTLRIEVNPVFAAEFSKCEGGAVIALWHNHLFVSAELHRRYRRDRLVGGLVSGSRDGAWLAAFFRTVGIVSIRGSQGHRSFGGTREAVRKVRSGMDLAITPDGSRGPRHRAKGGALLVAREAGVPLCVLGIAYGRSKALKTWDRFNLPLPFSRVVVDGTMTTPGPTGIEGLQAELDRSEEAARQRLPRVSP